MLPLNCSRFLFWLKRMVNVKKKMIYRIRWSVHPHRADKRTGVIGEQPKRSPYVQMLMDEIENQFKKKQ